MYLYQDDKLVEGISTGCVYICRDSEADLRVLENQLNVCKT